MAFAWACLSIDLCISLSRSMGINGNTRMKRPPGCHSVVRSGMIDSDLASCRILASRSESCGGVIAEGVVTLSATRFDNPAALSSIVSRMPPLNTVEKRPFL